MAAQRTWSDRTSSVPTAGRVFSPLDEALDLLPQQRYSPRVLQLVVRLSTWLPFERVPEALCFLAGVEASASTARRITEHIGAVLVQIETEEAERLRRESPVPPAGPSVQQVSADGAMIPLRGGQWAEARTVAIGTVEQRTTRTGAQEPHCTALSYFARLADAQTFTDLAVVATHARGTERAETVVGIMDGAPWLQQFLDVHRPDAVRVLDFPHAAEHLAEAAEAIFGPGSIARRWLADQLHVLKHEDPGIVLAALRALPAAPQAIRCRDQVVRYLEDRRAQIAYPCFRAQGYPIGSGIAESACKLVIEERMKGSGMHWAREHVNPMLALRGTERSGMWGERWIVLWQRQRDGGQAQRAERADAFRAAKEAQAAEAARATKAAQAPAVAPTRLGVLDGPPAMVNGKPTRHHPWNH